MSKKTKQTNTVAWSTPPSTPQTTQLQSMVGQSDYTPYIRNSFARARQNLSRSYQNPLGAYTTADVRDKSMRAQNADLSQQEAVALGNASQQNQQNAFSQQALVAQLTQPRLYQSGSTGQVSDPFSTALQVGGLGVGALTGGLGAKH